MGTLKAIARLTCTFHRVRYYEFERQAWQKDAADQIVEHPNKASYLLRVYEHGLLEARVPVQAQPVTNDP